MTNPAACAGIWSCLYEVGLFIGLSSLQGQVWVWVNSEGVVGQSGAGRVIYHKQQGPRQNCSLKAFHWLLLWIYYNNTWQHRTYSSFFTVKHKVSHRTCTQNPSLCKFKKHRLNHCSPKKMSETDLHMKKTEEEDDGSWNITVGADL